MKTTEINAYNLDENLATIVSCANALEELYYCSIESSIGSSEYFPFIVLVFAQRIKEAKHRLDAELEGLLSLDGNTEEIAVKLLIE